MCLIQTPDSGVYRGAGRAVRPVAIGKFGPMGSPPMGATIHIESLEHNVSLPKPKSDVPFYGLDLARSCLTYTRSASD